jgi:hypothetical protein
MCVLTLQEEKKTLKRGSVDPKPPKTEYIYIFQTAKTAYCLGQVYVFYFDSPASLANQAIF